MNRKVLIITYWFPPFVEYGICNRILKLIKYLPKYGWQPFILTVKNDPTRIAADKTLVTNIPGYTRVFRTYSIEPLHLRDNVKRIKKNNKTFSNKKDYLLPIKLFIRDLLTIPDMHIGWLPFAVLKGINLHNKNKYKVIYSSSYPNSNHIVGLVLKWILRIQWVVEFRDPWFQFGKRYSKYSKNLNSFLLKKIIDNSDKVITTTPYYTNELKKQFPLKEKKIHTIVHGYDPNDFQKINNNKNKNEKLVFSYVGTCDRLRNPKYFFKALYILNQKYPKLKNDYIIQFVGNFSSQFIPLINQYNLLQNIKLIKPVQYHESLKFMKSSDILLLLLSPFNDLVEDQKNSIKFASASKVYNYIGAGKYILGIIPDSGPAHIIKMIHHGSVIEPRKSSQIVNEIKNHIISFKTVGQIKFCPDKAKKKLLYSNEITKKISLILNIEI